MRITTLPVVPSGEGTHSNSVPLCYKIAAFRPDKARFALRDPEQVDSFIGRLSSLLGDAPLMLLPWEFMGQPVYIRRGYPAPYLVVGNYLQTFTLTNPVSPIPNFWIEVHSLPFWLLDGAADDILLQVVSHLWELLAHVAGEDVTLLLTGLHLCADVMADYHAIYGGQSSDDLAETYISRHIRPGSLPAEKGTSHWFGRSSNVRWNVYDKLEQIAKTGKDHCQDVWRAAGWQDGMPMTRVEAQLGKEYFSTHAPQFAGDVSVVPLEWLGSRVAAEAWYGFLGAIWADVTTRTRYTLDDDSNRSRATVHPFWQVVQAVALTVIDAGPVRRVNHALMQAVDRDVKAIAGYAKSVAGKLRRVGYIPSLDDVLGQVRSDVAVTLRAIGLPWEEAVSERVKRRAIPLSYA